MRVVELETTVRISLSTLIFERYIVCITATAEKNSFAQARSISKILAMKVDVNLRRTCNLQTMHQGVTTPYLETSDVCQNRNLHHQTSVARACSLRRSATQTTQHGLIRQIHDANGLLFASFKSSLTTKGCVPTVATRTKNRIVRRPIKKLYFTTAASGNGFEPLLRCMVYCASK